MADANTKAAAPAAKPANPPAAPAAKTTVPAPAAAAPAKTTPPASAAQAATAANTGNTAPVKTSPIAALENLFAHRTNQPVSKVNLDALNVAMTNFQAAINTVETGATNVDHKRLNESYMALTKAFHAIA